MRGPHPPSPFTSFIVPPLIAFLTHLGANRGAHTTVPLISWITLSLPSPSFISLLVLCMIPDPP